MYPRKTEVFNGTLGAGSGWVNSIIVSNLLWHHQTLFILHNLGASGLSYQIQATQDYYPATGTVQWVRIYPLDCESANLASSGVDIHKLTDPWDAARFRLRITISGGTTDATGYINSKPR